MTREDCQRLRAMGLSWAEILTGMFVIGPWQEESAR